MMFYELRETLNGIASNKILPTRTKLTIKTKSGNVVWHVNSVNYIIEGETDSVVEVVLIIE